MAPHYMITFPISMVFQEVRTNDRKIVDDEVIESASSSVFKQILLYMSYLPDFYDVATH
jgi:hypothetical protein